MQEAKTLKEVREKAKEMTPIVRVVGPPRSPAAPFLSQFAWRLTLHISDAQGS